MHLRVESAEKTRGEAPGKAGKVLQMKVLHSEGLASHAGPESCLWVRKGPWEALTGEGAGRVVNRVMFFVRSADARTPVRKATSCPSSWRDGQGLRAVLDPEHAPKHLTRNPGGPVFDHAEEVVRMVNPKGVRP